MRTLFYFAIILLSSTISCKQKKVSVIEEIKQVSEQINRLNVGDTLDLSLSTISFDKVVFLSHEVNWSLLKEEVSITNATDWQTFKSNYGNWAVVWINDYSVVAMVEFPQDRIMFNRIVGGDGYNVIEKSNLKPMLVVNSPNDKFLNSDNNILEIEPIE